MNGWAATDVGAGPLRVSRWDGSAWRMLPSPGTVSSYPPGLATPGGDVVFVAWVSEDDILVDRWDGTAWKELGDSATAGGVSRTGTAAWPALAVPR